MHNNITAYDILAALDTKLDKSKRTGDTLRARCPAHDDKTPSLNVTVSKPGDSVLVHCFAGCTTDAVLDALGWKMRDLFASDDAWRSHEARDIGDEADAAKLEASPLPQDTPGRVRLWIEALTDADLDAQVRVLHCIAGSSEWQQLGTLLRIAVVGAIKDHTVRSMATAILGRFDNVKLNWRNPPTEAVDTSEPDVVSLATLLADPLDPAATVARGLAFGGTMGFLRGPKASGKTTILAAAAARVSRGQPWAGHPTEAGTVLIVCNDDPRSWTLALRDFGADPDRILTARARVVSKPGKLAALLAEHRPTWVILDNLRTWCRSMQLDTDNSSAAADAIDPIAEAIGSVAIPSPAPSSTTKRGPRGSRPTPTRAGCGTQPCLRMRRTGSSAAPTRTARPRPRSRTAKRHAERFRPKRSLLTWTWVDTVHRALAAAMTRSRSSPRSTHTIRRSPSTSWRIPRASVSATYSRPVVGSGAPPWLPVSRPSARSERTSCGGHQNRCYPRPKQGGVRIG